MVNSTGRLAQLKKGKHFNKKRYVSSSNPLSPCYVIIYNKGRKMNKIVVFKLTQVTNKGK